jgi:hypothetical protein
MITARNTLQLSALMFGPMKIWNCGRIKWDGIFVGLKLSFVPSGTENLIAITAN